MLRYIVGIRLGEGSSGTVFQAWDREHARPVALKLVDASDRRFQREIKLLRAIRHPALVEYLDHGPFWGGRDFLAMSLITGPTLLERLREPGLPVGEAVLVARRIAQGLSALHDLGIVHRDVKPSNVVLRDGCAELATLVDFGVARRIEVRVTSMITEVGESVGTPGYMSPEQLRGERPTTATDVFALGCLLYRCLTGRSPFHAASLAESHALTLLRVPAPVSVACPGVPSGLERLIASMLRKNPAHRPQTGGDVVSLLDRVGDLPHWLRCPTSSLVEETTTPMRKGGVAC